MLRFGTIGSGWITDEYIKGAKDSGLWELTACYSRTKERGEEFASKHGAKLVFTSLEEMAASDELDAVYIASPNYLHLEQAKLFIENKKHVICEKPVSAQAAPLKEIIALAKENNVIFLEAIMYMHLPQRKILEENLKRVGDVNFAKIDFCQRSSKLDDFLSGKSIPNIFNPAMEAGALMDLGVYCVYPALHLFGKPEGYEAVASMLETGADSGGILTLKYPNKLVTITYSKLGQAMAGTEFQGNEGTLYVDSISRLAEMRFWDKTGEVEDIIGSEEKYKLMGYEAIDFYHFITKPEETKAFYEECTTLSLKVCELMEGLRKTMGIRFASDK